MYAIINDRGRQVRVEKGATVQFDLARKNAGDTIEFDQVLVYHDGEKVKVGTPVVPGVKVVGQVVKEFKDRKIRVYKYIRREGYHRTVGHRQRYTLVKITDIVAS
ncbi:MAG: 50S ribosomal protein L21 [Planctomycetes bacterium]|nr:50S ribosomal protein L21 [Planctomycetota bacterium]